MPILKNNKNKLNILILSFIIIYEFFAISIGIGTQPDLQANQLALNSNSNVGLSQFGVNNENEEPNLTTSEISNLRVNNSKIEESFKIERNTQTVRSASSRNIQNLQLAQITSNTFVSQWDTSMTSEGSSTNLQVRLPLESSGTYDFIVDWGDGTSDSVATWDSIEMTHTYASEGVYTITIDGTLEGWRFNDEGDKLKIIQISQWGNINLGNSDSYFEGASNLELIADDALDLTGTTTFYAAFLGCNN